jgi:hypothetical protein
MAKNKILYVDEEQNNLNAFNAYFRRKEAFSVKCSLSIKEAVNPWNNISMYLLLTMLF